ncbi:MAG: nucleoside hydrolase [Vampirovibrio sp.]|nr:nucleoside hydrolase [Vampirovibrio sp.]
MKLFLIRLLILLLLMGTGSFLPSAFSKTLQKPVVFIDTDIGSDVDDALALLTLLGSQKVEVIGISTVNSNTQKRAAVALRLLELAGHPDVPVAAGIGSTLLRQKQPRNWEKQLSQHLDHPPVRKPSAMHGVDLMIQTVHQHPGLTVIALGPLTNIAVAIIKDPTITPKIGKLIIVGGAIALPAYQQHGTITVGYKSEYNLNSDLDAARLVFDAGIPIVMSGLSPALQVTVGTEDVKSWQQLNTPVAVWVSNRVTERLTSHHATETHLGDVVGAMASYDSQSVRTKKLPLHLEVWGDTLRTVIDSTGTGTPVEVVLDVNQDQFYDNFHQAMATVLHGKKTQSRE